ncbi:D-lactaldehyde dehydrogenase [Leucogyrophana mollusca]|uniref:D-lactaldehyde dehydrogenase n=1 Tax=Leucogyrophana mollusca TaxID=85980 RepID=A0ACB8B8Q6_9AGAM|nr:D-lactaldehyde dehydrogenase [Leucogyrophana mollusca]
MPSLQPPPDLQKVLVSGANGYIGSWVVHTLLERGYSVRSAVRTERKGEHLKKIFGEYGGRHEVVVVADITKACAFDEAVKGVDAIEHIASPVQLEAEDPYELITPAVNGTVGILQSALAHGTSLKRIVVTSSCAAVLHDDPNPQEFDESDWNEQSLEILAKGGPALTGIMKYRASKTLAEKAVWQFWEDNQGGLSWDITVLIPPFVFGPAIHEVTTPASLNESALLWYNHLIGHTATGTKGGTWIDVRDLAEAHTLALERPAAGSKRIIVAAGAWTWQDFVNAAHAVSPPPKLLNGLPLSSPDASPADTATVPMRKYKTIRAAEILGLRYRIIPDTTKDTLADYEARGW